MRLITPMACSTRALTLKRLRLHLALHLTQVLEAAPALLAQVLLVDSSPNCVNFGVNPSD